MPKPANSSVISELLTISTTILRKKGLFHRSGPTEVELTWSNNGSKQVSHSIGVVVCTIGVDPYIRVNYSTETADFNYSIPLVYKPSNLGKGRIWYMKCRDTQLRCRKLFLYNDQFVGRMAIIKDGGVYASELRPRRINDIHRQHDRIKRLLKIVRQSFKANYKAEFKGKPTKRALKIGEAKTELKGMGFKTILDAVEFLGF